MRAAVLEGVDRPVVTKEVPEPAPAPGSAVVRLRAAALNHRDVWIQKGMYAGLKFPVVLGSDGAGTVAAVGADADRAWVGREVVINPSLDWGPDPRAQGAGFRILGLPDDGTFAEAIRVPVANLAPKPPHLSWEQAATLPLAGLTAYRALFTRARLRAGEKVLVTGIGGGVALFALQFALAAGATVWVTSGSAEKLRRARDLGAAGGASYRDPDWSQALQTEAGLFDVVVDSAGGEGFGRLIELAAPGGRIVFFGATTANPPGIDLRRCFFRQLTLLGTTMGSPPDFAGMLALVAARRLEPVVDEVFALDAAETAFRRMEAGAQFGKIVLRP
ncbi:MAG TPA: zinc-binding dehydrogenase [Candidatus Binatia bacterium]|nr:zinc-binding dehydrogenase [Candidatus Binatia bacterium]